MINNFMVIILTLESLWCCIDLKQFPPLQYVDKGELQTFGVISNEELFEENHKAFSIISG